MGFRFYLIVYQLSWVILSHIKICKLATRVQSEMKSAFSIATKPWCREGRYSIPEMAPLDP